MTRTHLANQYAKDNPHCELYRLLTINHHHIDKSHPFLVDVLRQPVKFAEFDIHHIFGSPRTDNRTNMISLCVPIHRTFCHPHNSLARLLCLWVKMDKTPCELDLEEFRAASGKYLEGWLALNEPKQDWALGYWRELGNYERLN